MAKPSLVFNGAALPSLPLLSLTLSLLLHLASFHLMAPPTAFALSSLPVPSDIIAPSSLLAPFCHFLSASPKPCIPFRFHFQPRRLCLSVDLLPAGISRLWGSVLIVDLLLAGISRLSHVLQVRSEAKLEVMMMDFQLNFYVYCGSTSSTTLDLANAILRVSKYPSFLSNENSVRFYYFLFSLILIMASSPNSVMDATIFGDSESFYVDDDPAPSVEMAMYMTLAGKLLAPKKMFASNLTSLAARLWKCPDRLCCFDHGRNLFSFEFTHPPDVEAVLEGGPWFIGGDLLLISRMNQSKAIEHMSFDSTKLWVRCFDLPPKCFILKAAVAIGNGLGGFSGTDLPSENPETAKLCVRRVPMVRRYLRVKFICNLNQPLQFVHTVTIGNPVAKTVENFKTRLAYERLPLTCYRCGFIGHVVEKCNLSGPLIFGDWIRAEHFFRFISEGASSVMPGWTPPNRSPVASNRPSSSSSTQVRHMRELVKDSSIVQASFSHNRDLGSLPAVGQSKGKAPLVEHSQFGGYNSSLVPFVSSTSNASPKGTGGIIGPIPDSSALPPQFPSIADSGGNNECPMVSYFNPAVPHEDLFSPTNRCLFKNDMALPAFSSSIKGVEVSPGEKTMNFTDLLNSQSVLPSVTTSVNEKKKATPAGKKRTAGPSSPRPKRGRSAANALNIG